MTSTALALDHRLLIPTVEPQHSTGGRAMSCPDSGEDFLFREVARRVAAWLREAYPDNAAKMIAADLGVSPDTAKGWLAGKMPANRHMIRLKRRFGGAFVAFVYEPFAWSRDYDLRARIDELRGRLDELKEKLDQADTRESDGLDRGTIGAGGAKPAR